MSCLIDVYIPCRTFSICSVHSIRIVHAISFPVSHRKLYSVERDSCQSVSELKVVSGEFSTNKCGCRISCYGGFLILINEHDYHRHRQSTFWSALCFYWPNLEDTNLILSRILSGARQNVHRKSLIRAVERRKNYHFHAGFIVNIQALTCCNLADAVPW